MSRAMALSVLLAALPLHAGYAQTDELIDQDDAPVERPLVLRPAPPRVIPRTIPLPPRRPANLAPIEEGAALAPPPPPVAPPLASPIPASPAPLPVPVPTPTPELTTAATPAPAPIPPAEPKAAAVALPDPVAPSQTVSDTRATDIPFQIAPVNLPLPTRARNEPTPDITTPGIAGTVQSGVARVRSGISEWWYGQPAPLAAIEEARRDRLFEAAMAAAGFDLASTTSEGVFLRSQNVVFVGNREPTPLEVQTAERLAAELNTLSGLRGYAEQAAIREALSQSSRDPALQKTIEVQLLPYPWVKSISGMTASAGRKAP